MSIADAIECYFINNYVSVCYNYFLEFI